MNKINPLIFSITLKFIICNQTLNSNLLRKRLSTFTPVKRTFLTMNNDPNEIAFNKINNIDVDLSYLNLENDSTFKATSTKENGSIREIICIYLSILIFIYLRSKSLHLHIYFQN
jgi:hypothetical protein